MSEYSANPVVKPTPGGAAGGGTTPDNLTLLNTVTLGGG